MYLEHFGLTEAPFSIAPDPHFLYLSQRHQEALAHLLYGVNGDGGFVLLTGEVGSGKTTICRCLLEQVPEHCDVAYIFNPKLTAEELLSTVCTEFRIDYPAGNTSIKVFIDLINTHLLDAHAKGRHTVLIIDEAQNLSTDVLEQMRLLTNLETNQRKLLQIILIGQPELLTMLARPELRQLSQRIIARYHLDPLSKNEIAAYVSHRLEVSGGKRQLLPDALMARLYRLSGGVPRLINVLCDRALLGTFAQGKERVDKATLEQAAREVLHQTSEPLITRQQMLFGAKAFGTLAIVAVLALLINMAWQHRAPQAAPSTSTKPAADKTGGATTPASVIADVLTWPESEGKIADSRMLAEAALLKLWGANTDTGKDLCRQAKRLDMRCFSGEAGKNALDELRQLNRPAVLKLRPPTGQDFYATLTAIGDKRATLKLGQQSQSLTLTALEKQWTGQYTLIWRLPSGVYGKLQPGDRGPAVRWLAGQLANWQGLSSDWGENLGKYADKYAVYDQGLVREVKQFQSAHGLVADGTAGAKTLLHLTRLGDENSPSLERVIGAPRTDAKPSLQLKTALELGMKADANKPAQVAARSPRPENE